ncbi:MAG: hypothetical protein ACE14L_07260 [Terriglobales bacterium]
MKRTFVPLLFMVLTLPAVAQRGAITVPRNLAELTAQSATILRGRIVSAHVEPMKDYSALSTVVVTLAVDEVLKGSAGQIYTFRQFIWDIRDRQDAAGYRKGQQMLLLLNPPTRLGLVSPAGLDQGRFRIRREGTRTVAVNGVDNYHLLQGVEPVLRQRGVQPSTRLATTLSRHQRGAISLDELQEVIRHIARAQ